MKKIFFLLICISLIGSGTFSVYGRKTTHKKQTKTTTKNTPVSFTCMNPEFTLEESIEGVSGKLENIGFKLVNTTDPSDDPIFNEPKYIYEKDIDGNTIQVTLSGSISSKVEIKFPNTSLRDAFISDLTKIGFKKNKRGIYMSPNKGRQAEVDGVTINVVYGMEMFNEDPYKSFMQQYF